MDRLACVNVGALPLQILLGDHRDWARFPVAVVEDDRPQALVQFCNVHARRAGVRAGQRYATALALARELRAAAVSQTKIAEAVTVLINRLRRHSPHVEPSSDVPGVFWLDAQGLHRLYASPHAWAEEIRADLRSISLHATIAVAGSRFGSYALAIAHRRTVVCRDEDDERARVARVPLSRLAMEPDDYDRLHALGIHTVGDFLRLPADGLRARFSASTQAMHRLAAGQRWAPLVPVPAVEPHEQEIEFDAPERHVERLLFVLKRSLDALITALAHDAQALVALSLRLTLDNRTTQDERVRPAAPTLDAAQLLALVRLRLETLQLAAGIVAMTLTAETCPAAMEQCRLFSEQTRRNVDAANRAFARIRAECGEHSIVRARICDAHLPTARFLWQPLDKMPARAAPRVVATRPLVRRIYTTPIALPRATAPAGPPAYVVSGGWWGTAHGGGAHRDYYFVRAANGELLWLYYDRRRERMFLQGRVE